MFASVIFLILGYQRADIDITFHITTAGNLTKVSVLKVKDYFENPGDHADEVETSVMMHYHPELVNLEEAGSGEYKTFAVQSLNEKVAWIPRNWGKVSKDTGVGDPRGASAEKGKKFAEAVAEKYARLFDELVNQKLY